MAGTFNQLVDLGNEIEKVKSDKPEIIESIQSSGKLEEDTEKLVTQIIEEYKKG